MKDALKRLLPAELRPKAARLFRRFRHRTTPKFRSMRYANGDVLQCCVAYTELGAYCVPLSQHYAPAAQLALRGRVYERETIEFICANSGDGDVVHAGAYIGDFLPGIGRVSGAVWAFEPQGESFRCAEITAKLNGLDNVRLFHAGLGASSGVARMLTANADGHLGSSSRIDDSGKDEIRIVALDDLIPQERRVSLIHLDIEGFEEQALLGAERIIARCRPILVLETLPSEQWLSQHRYEPAGRVNNNTVLKPH